MSTTEQGLTIAELAQKTGLAQHVIRRRYMSGGLVRANPEQRACRSHPVRVFELSREEILADNSIKSGVRVLTKEQQERVDREGLMTIQEIGHVTGLTRSQVRYLVDMKLVKPAMKIREDSTRSPIYLRLEDVVREQKRREERRIESKGVVYWEPAPPPPPKPVDPLARERRGIITQACREAIEDGKGSPITKRTGFYLVYNGNAGEYRALRPDVAPTSEEFILARCIPDLQPESPEPQWLHHRAQTCPQALYALVRAIQIEGRKGRI